MDTKNVPQPSRAAPKFAPTEKTPPSDPADVARSLHFWLGEIEASIARVEAGKGTTHDIRVLHQGPILAMRMGNWMELRDDARWTREQSAVAKVMAETMGHSIGGIRYDDEDARGHAAHYKPLVQEVRNSLSLYDQTGSYAAPRLFDARPQGENTRDRAAKAALNPEPVPAKSTPTKPKFSL